MAGRNTKAGANDAVKGTPFFITSNANHYLLSVMIVGVAALLCAPLSNTRNYHVVSFVLLFIVSFLATFIDTMPISLAAAMSALVWNFFFIPPRYTFHIDKTEDVLMFGMFFIIAMLNGVLTTRVRKHERLAREREERTNALFQLTKGLAKALELDEIRAVAIKNIKAYFGVDARIYLWDGKDSLRTPEQLQQEKVEDYEIAKQVFAQSKEPGGSVRAFCSGVYSFFGLSGTRLNPGVVAVQSGKAWAVGEKTFWEAFLTQIANALEREFLGELAQRARFLDESEKLYKTLFNSISHELRIPVATILGSAETLLTTPHPDQVQAALHKEILTASLRLNRLIENLLNMSRLESGRISARLDWYDMNDLINKVVPDLKEELKPFQLLVSFPEDMPLVKIDFGLMEQVLYNLLFNSCEYGAAATNIRLNVYHESNELFIDIMDRGPGFPGEEIKRVFKKYFRANGVKAGGLGLGLSIVKGFVEAHKGTISVANREGGGAIFSIKIPAGNHQMESWRL